MPDEALVGYYKEQRVALQGSLQGEAGTTHPSPAVTPSLTREGKEPHPPQAVPLLSQEKAKRYKALCG